MAPHELQHLTNSERRPLLYDRSLNGPTDGPLQGVTQDHPTGFVDRGQRGVWGTSYGIRRFRLPLHGYLFLWRGAYCAGVRPSRANGVLTQPAAPASISIDHPSDRHDPTTPASR